jgi:AAA15 family ATPase/GTPase
MQLIYLYIENYKNIKNQGFNFSPRFSCNFDNDILRIDTIKNHINIYPSNIDITAIVGKNGSGKSSIQKFILYLIFYNKYKTLDEVKFDDTDEDNKYTKKVHIEHKNLELDGTRGFLIIKKDNSFYKLSLMIDSYIFQRV